jgi:hypothetical protein
MCEKPEHKSSYPDPQRDRDQDYDCHCKPADKPGTESIVSDPVHKNPSQWISDNEDDCSRKI